MLCEHPLEPLSRSENDEVVAVLRKNEVLKGRVRIVHLLILEPLKETVFAWQPGQFLSRRVEATLFDHDRNTCIRAVVALDRGSSQLLEVVDIRGVQPLITPDELDECEAEVLKMEELKQTLQARYGNHPVAKMENLMCDTWAVGHYGGEDSRNRRLARVFLFYRDPQSLNPYAYPIDGIQVIMDLNTMRLVEITNTGSTVPLPPHHDSRYVAAQMGDDLRKDLKPLNIVQEDGPSFKVSGHRVDWQKWSFVVGFNGKEGLTLHDIRCQNRPILYRVSLSDMVVPYGDPSDEHSTKNAFDVSDYGIGFCANSLELGCDCLGEIHYFDAEMVTSKGEPWTLKNAVCLHEEDFGVLWKHYDRHTSVGEVRRSRRLVVSFFVTAENYDYGFFWYFYQDGTIQLETKMTGFLSIGSVHPNENPKHGNLVAPQIYAPNHQHFFNFRLDFAIDGIKNTISQVDVVRDEANPQNRQQNAFHANAKVLRRERDAMSHVCQEKARTWSICNPSESNALGMSPAYKLIPGENTVPLAHPSAWWRRRAGFTKQHIWVTSFHETERFCVGDFPNQNPKDEGLPEYTNQNRDIENVDCVVWYTFGITHIPRPEDHPVMPVVYAGFTLKPFGFFLKNPSWDVPPQPMRCMINSRL